LKYANEAVLPFYILHQTVLLCVGYFVTRWQIADSLKLMIIGISSFSFIMITYEFLIRQNNVLRFLFGMKPRSVKSSSNPIPEKMKPAQDLSKS
jgi:glucan biosynthesis protein C